MILIRKLKGDFLIHFYSSITPTKRAGILNENDIIFILQEKSNIIKEYSKMISKFGVGYVWRYAISQDVLKPCKF